MTIKNLKVEGIFQVTIKQGIKYSFGTASLGLGLSMFTFGAFLKSSGFTIWQSFSSTFFALPQELFCPKF